MRSEASGLALAIYNRRKASSKAIWFYGTATSGSGAIQFPSCAGTSQGRTGISSQSYTPRGKTSYWEVLSSRIRRSERIEDKTIFARRFTYMILDRERPTDR